MAYFNKFLSSKEIVKPNAFGELEGVAKNRFLLGGTMLLQDNSKLITDALLRKIANNNAKDVIENEAGATAFSFVSEGSGLTGDDTIRQFATNTSTLNYKTIYDGNKDNIDGIRRYDGELVKKFYCRPMRPRNVSDVVGKNNLDLFHGAKIQ